MQGLSRVALETIVNIIPAGIVLIEKENGKVSYVNHRAVEILGFNPRGLSFKEYALSMAKAHKLGDAPYLYEQLPLIKALLYGKTIHNEEIIIQRRNQSEVTTLTNTSPLTDDKGEITGALAIFEDITERKKLEEDTRRLLSAI